MRNEPVKSSDTANMAPHVALSINRVHFMPKHDVVEVAVGVIICLLKHRGIYHAHIIYI